MKNNKSVNESIVDAMRQNNLTLLSDLLLSQNDDEWPLHSLLEEDNVDKILDVLNFLKLHNKDMLCHVLKIQSEEGYTIINLALYHSHYVLLYWCLEHLDQKSFSEISKLVDIDDENILHSAVSHGDVKILSCILRGLDAETRYQLLSSRNNNEEMPMHLAAFAGKDKLIQQMLKFLNRSELSELLVARDIDYNNVFNISLYNGHVNIATNILQFLSGSGNSEILRKMLLSRNYDGRTALHLSIFNNYTEIVAFILHYLDEKIIHYVLSAKDSGGNTPLHLAAASGNIEIVAQLLRSLERLNDVKTLFVQENLFTSLQFAVTRGHSEIVAQILRLIIRLKNKNAGIDFPVAINIGCALHLAVDSGKDGLVRQILRVIDSDKDLLMSILMVKDQLGNTPLHIAIALDFSVIVRDIFGSLSKFKDDPAVIQLLTTSNVNKNTLLHLAASNGSVASVECFFGFISQLNDCKEVINSCIFMLDDNDRNILNYAASNGKTELIDKIFYYLFNLELDESAYKLVTISDVNGNYPLHMAAISDNINVVKSIINAFSIKNVQELFQLKNNEGKTVFAVAISDDMKMLLCSIGANFASMDNIDSDLAVTYVDINQESDIREKAAFFDRALYIVVSNDALRALVDASYSEKIISTKEKNVIESSVKSIEIAKQVQNTFICRTDISSVVLNLINGYVFSTFDRLYFMEALRRVQYSNNSIYKYRLYLASMILEKKLAFDASTIKGNPMLWAIKQGYVEEVISLLELFSALDNTSQNILQEFLLGRDEALNTPLHLAVAKDYVDVVEVILKSLDKVFAQKLLKLINDQGYKVFDLSTSEKMSQLLSSFAEVKAGQQQLVPASSRFNVVDMVPDDQSRISSGSGDYVSGDQQRTFK